MHLKKIIEREYKELEECIKLLEKELNELPQGTMLSKTINGKRYIYQQFRNEFSNGKFIQKYISKDVQLQNGIVRRRIIEDSLPILKHNLKYLEKALSKIKKFDLHEICSNLPGGYKPVPYKCQKIFPDIDITAWLNEPYNTNPKFGEQLIHDTISGGKVRSKSEALISYMLSKYEIPYRYEPELVIDGCVLYPDFELLRVRDKKLFYWEHFGMMDNEQYAQNAHSKIKLLGENGIVQWSNLITTFETKDGGIDTQLIDNVIRTFLL